MKALSTPTFSPTPRSRTPENNGRWIAEAGCDTLFSEDMQHGRIIGDLAIVNPFLDNAP